MYVKICERIEKMGYSGKRITSMMDIESSDIKFNLRLEELLRADDGSFVYDVIGIFDNVVRDSFPATDFGFFVPKFAETK